MRERKISLSIDFLNKKWSRVHVIMCLIFSSIFMVNILYGWYRLKNAPIQLSSHEKVKVIQANINTAFKKDTMDINAEKIIIGVII